MRRLLGWLPLLGLVACGPDHPPTSEGLYLRHCARCHQPDGRSVAASEQAREAIDLRDLLFQRHVSDEEIRRIIRLGQGKMEGFPELAEAEVDSLVLQVRKLGRAAAAGR